MNIRPILYSLILFCAPVQALDWRVGTILSSHHWDDYDYNEEHKGLYGCLDDWCAGAFDNSYGEDSIALSRRWTVGHWGPVEFDVNIGAVKGYQGYVTNNEWLLYATVGMKYSILRGWQVGTATVIGAEVTSDDWRKWNN